jgi:uncharacterized membrane protein (DUF2068 family)
MDDEIRQLQDIAKGDRAKQIVESAEWQEAFQAYRDRIMQEVEKAPSNDADTVMHLKRLLSAANAAKAHLEALLANGKIAQANLQLIETRKRWFKRVA